MNNLSNYLKDFQTAEKRSALYYLFRYIKQAKAFKNYQKDIFEDGVESVPNEKIKSLTLKMADHIEITAGKKASEFTNEEFLYWIDTIAELENNIDEEPDEEQMQKAIDQLKNFDIPKENQSL